jgi:hypothetical protein
MKYKCEECPVPCYLSLQDEDVAFPSKCPYDGTSIAKWKEVPDDTLISGASGFPGTLRDWFAGQALAGLLSARFDKNNDDEMTAMCCWDITDAMIATRERKES